MSFNKVIILGNLTRDCELRYSTKGTAVASVDLATNRTWKTESGEEREEVCFIPVTAFGRQAETIFQYLRKGDPLLVEGRLTLEQWDDKQTGAKRSKMKVTLESFTFVGGKKDRAEQEPPAAAPRTGGRPQTAAELARGGYQRDSSANQPPPPEEDVPF